jgi:hypothetical protein
MDEVPWYVSLVVSWMPFIFMVFVWLAIGRSLARRIEQSLRTPDGRAVGQVIEELTHEMRRTNDLMGQRLKSP